MPPTSLYSQMNSKEVKVQDLGESLGFRNGTERPLHTLTVTTHEWRKKWMGSNGKLGTDLRDRKSEEGKDELRLMTHAYLESGGLGLRLWPERPQDCPRTAPEYPRDKEKITELLLLLFWKHNVLEYGKGKAKKPDKCDVTSNTLSRGRQIPPVQHDSASSCQPSEEVPSPPVRSASSVKHSATNIQPLTERAILPSGDGPIDVSDDELPSRSEIISQYSQTPKQPPRAASGDQLVENGGSDQEAKGLKEKASLAATENTGCSLRGVAPVAIMTASPAVPDMSPITAQRLLGAVADKTFSHNKVQQSNEDDFDSAYDDTPPIRSPLQSQVREPAGDNWGSGCEVHNPNILRRSTRARAASISEENHTHNDDRDSSTIALPAPRNTAPEASKYQNPDVQIGRNTAERVLSRKRNISGLYTARYDDELANDDPSHNPTKVSEKKRTVSQRPSSFLDGLKEAKRQRRFKSPERQQIPNEPNKSPNTALSTRLGCGSLRVQQPHDHHERVSLGHVSERALSERPRCLGLTMSSPSTIGSATSPVSPTAQLPGQKRVHLTSACSACHRKKIQCNGKEPCSRCTNRDECTYDPFSNPRHLTPSSPDDALQTPDQVVPLPHQQYGSISRQDDEVDDGVDNALSFLGQQSCIAREEQQLPSPKPSNRGALECSEIEDIQMDHPTPNLHITTPLKESGYPSPRPSGNRTSEHAAQDGGSSIEPRRLKRKKTNIDGGDEDADYTPSKRTKRRKVTSPDPTKPSITKSRPARLIRLPEVENEESSIVRTVENRGATLPSRVQRVSTRLFVSQESAGTIAQAPLSPANISTGHLLNEGIEYTGTLERNSQEPLKPPHSQGDKACQNNPISGTSPPAPSFVADLKRAREERRLLTSDTKSGGNSTGPIQPSDPMPVNLTQVKAPASAAATNHNDSEPTREAQPAPAPAPTTTEAHHARIPAAAQGPAPIPKPTSESHTIPFSEPILTSQAEPVSEAKADTNINSKVQVRYTIIISRAPRLVRRRWPIGSLSSKTVETVFEELSAFTFKKNIEQIDFTLETSQGEYTYPIQRGDAENFDEMTHDFSRDITHDIESNGKMNFMIWLEPDPGGEGEVVESKRESVGEIKQLV